ncbi:hypothetical protein J6590_018081 [Homalodisca vitripennis]|nr:hypothetical protein J6590_018081 [Homalodisca vitripennis]
MPNAVRPIDNKRFFSFHITTVSLIVSTVIDRAMCGTTAELGSPKGPSEISAGRSHELRSRKRFRRSQTRFASVRFNCRIEKRRRKGQSNNIIFDIAGQRGSLARQRRARPLPLAARAATLLCPCPRAGIKSCEYESFS